jgi:small subunit ribosomal protein S4e
VLKFAVGSTVMVTKGRSTGRVGVLTKVEKHDGSFDIVEVKDTTGAVFATRLPNVFVIGRTADPTACAIKLPKGDGIKRDIFEQRDSSRRKA